MASPHTLRTVAVDGEQENMPIKGQIIKLRLGCGPEGSLASATSPSLSVVSTAASPPHSVLVLRSRIVPHGQSLALEITCFAIYSYHREADPVKRVLTHPVSKRFLPLPSPQHVPTPPEFGEPIRVGDYVSDRPCWVNLIELTVLLKFGQRFKVFNPPVQVESGELHRIVNYAHYEIDPEIATFEEREQLGMALGGGADEDSDWESAVYSSPADFYRSLPQDLLDDEGRAWVEADDARKAEEKKSRVESWLGGLF